MGDREASDRNVFLSNCFSAMTEFSLNKVTMEEVFRLIERHSHNIDTDVARFVLDTVSEIDGFPCDYKNLVELLGSQPSHDEVLLFMNKKP